MSVICPECQAERASQARFCWLCGTPLAQIAEPPPVFPQLPPGPHQSGAVETPAAVGKQTTFNVASAAMVVLVLVVLFGVWFESRGLAGLLAVLLAPALLVTFIKSWSREVRSRHATAAGIGPDTARALDVGPMTAGQRISTFLVTLAGTLFAVIGVAAVCALVAIASFVAWFVNCLNEMGHMNR